MAQRRVIGPTAWVVGGAGLFIGAVAAWLVSQGNPGNMGLCIACFLRDITGFFVGGVTNQGAVAYIRPEIIGIILGAMGAALFTREFRSRGGSAPLVRFVLVREYEAGLLYRGGRFARRLGPGARALLPGWEEVLVVDLRSGSRPSPGRRCSPPTTWGSR